MYTLQYQASHPRYKKDITHNTLLGWLIVLCLIWGYSWSTVTRAAEDWVYVVQPGDNLWFLSANLLKDLNYYDKFLRYNSISEPKPLQPGTQLRVPTAWLKTEPAKVKVVHSRGDTQVFRRAHQQAKRLKKGDVLGLGDRIRTGPDSNITLEFADSSILVLQAQTEVVLDTLKISAGGIMVETRVRLKQGRGEAAVPSAREPPPNFEIITPESVTSVRGTKFRVEANSERHISLSEVIEGVVEVAAAGNSRMVNAGYGVVAEAGKPLQEPRALLAQPDLAGVPARIESLPTTLSWPAIDGAKNYRIQIAKDRALTALIIDSVLTMPNYTLASLPNGRYVLRVRAMDELGLEGLNSDFNFTLDIPPGAPVAKDTEDKDSTDGERPEFRWEPVEGARGYRLQVARDWTFRDIILDVKVGATDHYKLPKSHPGLPPNTYYSRVASIDKSGKLSPFSTPKIAIVRSLSVTDRPTLSQ